MEAFILGAVGMGLVAAAFQAGRKVEGIAAAVTSDRLAHEWTHGFTAGYDAALDDEEMKVHLREDRYDS